MRGRSWLSLVGACAVLLVTARSQAQCTMDTECAGEDVCEDGQCVESAAAPTVAAAPTAAAAPRVAAAPSAAAPPVALTQAAPEAPPPQPTMVRYSPLMMAAGIVMMPLAIGALVVAANNAGHSSPCGSGLSSQSCDNDSVREGALLTAAALVAVGVPLIVIGAKKEPAKPNVTATLTPWATATGVGVGLRISL